MIRRLIGLGRMSSLRDVLMRASARFRATPLMILVLAGSGALAFCALIFAAWIFIANDAAEGSAAAEWRAPTFDGKTAQHMRPVDDAQTLARPIFSKSRRPAQQTASASPTPLANAPDVGTNGMVLSAVVKSRGARQAFLVSPNNPEGQWLKVGEALGAWRIEKIDDTRIELKNGPRSTQLRLYSQDDDLKN